MGQGRSVSGAPLNNTKNAVVREYLIICNSNLQTVYTGDDNILAIHESVPYPLAN